MDLNENSFANPHQLQKPYKTPYTGLKTALKNILSLPLYFDIVNVETLRKAR